MLKVTREETGPTGWEGGLGEGGEAASPRVRFDPLIRKLGLATPIHHGTERSHRKEVRRGADSELGRRKAEHIRNAVSPQRRGFRN